MTDTHTTLTLIRPDDWHLHLRDGKQMQDVLPDTAKRFARAIVMPNLRPPITTVEQAIAYRERILAALPISLKARFIPLMTLYLTDSTLPAEIETARKSAVVHAVKLYPAGATTNADAGVTDITQCFATLEMMEQLGMPLLVHGEVTDPDIDVFDREKIFIDRVLRRIVQRFPSLRIVFEHITTREAIEFVYAASGNIAATITAHHLLLNRNALFAGGIRPHHYCLPVLKREIHRLALIEAATSGNPKFFLGTDSAPHPLSAKESTCGCAGIYTAHAAIELYAEVFEQAGALDKLEGFASFHGADFYHLPRNTDTLRLVKDSWTVPTQIKFGKESLVPLRAGGKVSWKILD
ncbi:dihydroorotase [Nitrosomonas nitrosa]|uniref:Dihydroorotase n=1 Tax=Nitrosomonas nitrosa TaxID=52442 RepID=A0A1I4MI36_9PROT|nr:dihydroorotase [Nitrosomonas nitrosa]PTQ91513.1 dihydroorotase [Nitrosomonas nitrosa]SFM02697.1 dihydroorotase [Nitrosomonas nitrosa]